MIQVVREFHAAHDHLYSLECKGLTDEAIRRTSAPKVHAVPRGYLRPHPACRESSPAGDPMREGLLAIRCEKKTI